MNVSEHVNEMFNRDRIREEKVMLEKICKTLSTSDYDTIVGNAIKLYYRAVTAAEDCRDMLDIRDIYEEVNKIE